MGEDLRPLTYPEKLKEFALGLLDKFKKSPYVIPGTAGLVAVVFYLMLLFLLETCLVSLLPPFVMLGLFWFMGIKRAKKLLLAGIIACMLMLIIEAVFFVGVASNYEPTSARSNDTALTLRDGVVDPAKGDAQTPFNFTIDVYKANNSTVNSVVLRYKGLSSGWINVTMSPVPGMANDTYARYSFVTTLSEPVYQFCFAAQVDGVWIEAWHYLDDFTKTTVFGPVYDDDFEILKPMLYLAAMQTFLQYYLVYTLLVGMIWWTRRARRMREQQLEKWAQKQKEAEAASPKDEAKVPSLAKAMGLEKDDSEDTFVCSECGADVPADATKCPNCGEKFD
jgi:hypothetical protein